ncbi:UMP kinase [Candidatus Riesia pediculischaeffi]|uniref:Uridylate kinase n=2 Tax=Candidatus Riesia pediculischaeffi TaxID=428411 RepID=A0A1V0HKC1_9ENTR|nr:UMP kinase [Candidatus Riesia pediculischaeffi]ARC53274.1 uridylate kinase [Candidatus Riesia pediculischaeffi]KIE64052.1 Uridylate kinase [Candidatus Riesia pediculischaeffi PTSU]
MSHRNSKPAYRRILLKISGEILRGSQNYGIDPIVLNRIVIEIKELVELSVQVGIVIGGGNFFRGNWLEKFGTKRVTADHMGMLVTIINGLAMNDALNQINVQNDLMSAIPLDGICKRYNWIDAINLLRNNRVVIFSAGTGNPFFTTDSAACLRGIEIKADLILKATKVDGIYSSDPFRSDDAKLYKNLTYQEVIKKELKIMDLTAFDLARNYNFPIRIFNINKSGALRRIIMGSNEGTLVSSKNKK